MDRLLVWAGVAGERDAIGDVDSDGSAERVPVIEGLGVCIAEFEGLLDTELDAETDVNGL